MKAVFIAVALVAASTLASASETLDGPYFAEIVRVIDGDTVEARVHIWLGLDQTVHVRIRDIDAPELHAHCPAERTAAEAAREHLIGLLGVDPVILTRIAYDKYGSRIDAALRLPNGEDVGAAMLATHHARPWPHAKVNPWCSGA